MQNIIQVRVERFVEIAEVLAQPFEDELTCLLLVIYLKGPDAEFAFHCVSLLSNEFFCFQIEHGYGQTQFSTHLRHLVQPGFQQRKDLLFVLWIDHLSPAL